MMKSRGPTHFFFPLVIPHTLLWKVSTKRLWNYSRSIDGWARAAWYRGMVPKVLSLEQQHQYHWMTHHMHAFLGPIQNLLTEKLWMWGHVLCP